MTRRLEQVMRGFDAVGGRGVPGAALGVAFRDQPEAVRVAAVLRSGQVPEDCGSDICDAPARGPAQVVDFVALYPHGRGDYVPKPAGHAGRRTLRVADVFDVMAAQARRRGAAMWLTPSQIDAGRRYRGLVEARDSGAMRCISLEAMMGAAGGGSREGFTDHRLEMSRRIDAMVAAVGSGLVRPVGAVGAVLPCRAVVDAVCLRDVPIGQVMAVAGWPRTASARRVVCGALADALSRMQNA